MYSHTQIRKAIFIILALAVFAWLAMVVSDTSGAETDATTSTVHHTLDRDANAVPGSTLEGINGPLSEIIWYNGAKAAEEQRAAEAEAARQRQAAIATQPSATVSAPRPVSPRATQCPAEIVDLIHKYWDRFGVDVAEWAIGIAWRESNCRPDVTSPTGCAGVFQTAVPLHGGLYASLGYDWHTAAWQAEPNIAVAAALYASSGPGPWRL